MASADMMQDDIEDVRLPYSRRPEWEDVSPIHVNDGNCVVAVQYTDEHRDALSYFRAILNSGEKSERALMLTADMIGFNQADYTAWQHRWLCVEALDSDLEVENKLTRSIMRDNAKNYQLWNHRRKCALRAGPAVAQTELDFAAEALKIDDKNYHAWAHRMAIVQAFGLWEQELEFVQQLLVQDVRNNSAWNQRAFVIKHLLLLQGGDAPHASPAPGPATASDPMSTEESGSGSSTPGSAAAGASLQGSRQALEELIARELKYVAEQVQRAPRNESAWNFLLGLFTLPGCHRREIARWPQVHAICVDALNEAPSCAPALAALADYYFVVAEAAMDCVAAAKAGGRDLLPSSAVPAELVHLLQSGLTALQAAAGNAASLLDGLTVADPIRTMYWVHRQQALQQMLVTAAQDVGAAMP